MNAIADALASSITRSAQDRRERIDAVIAIWRAGIRPPDAVAALTADPNLAGDSVLASDLAYEEFCLREEKGERMDVDAFCARFPFRSVLNRLLNIHQIIEDHPGVLLKPRRWPSPGDRVGDFVVLRPLGRGAYSQVYLATEVTAGSRPVALKVTTEAACDSRLLGPLSHPHLIPVLSSPRVGEWAVVAMPFYGIATLENVVEAAWPIRETNGRPRSGRTILDAANRAGCGGDPPFTDASSFQIGPDDGYENSVRAIAGRVCSGIEYLHARGIAHRDLKPTNVLLGPTGHPYILDFNHAVAGRDGGATGTLPYMSPEQLRLVMGGAKLEVEDWRPADIFATGVMLFELLTGSHPYAPSLAFPKGRSEAEIATQLFDWLEAGPRSAADLNPRVSRALSDAIDRCLSWDPARRPSAGELLAAVAPASRRRPGRMVAALFLATACLAGAATVLLPMMRGTAPAGGGEAAPAEAAVVRQTVVQPITRMDAGLRFYHEKGYGLAADEFRLEALDQKNGRAYALAGYCFSLNRSNRPAETMFNEAIRLGFTTEAVYADRAFVLLRLGRYAEAVADCTEALRQRPGLLVARSTRAMAHLHIAMRKGLAPPPPEAIADIDSVLDGPSIDAEDWQMAAGLYALSEDASGARRDRAAWFVWQAVLAGKLPGPIGRDPMLAPRLSGHPIFEEALTLHIGPSNLKERNRLVNPDPEFLSPDP